MNTIIIRYEGLSPSWAGDAVTGQKGTVLCKFYLDKAWDDYPIRYMVVTRGEKLFPPVMLSGEDEAELLDAALTERCFLQIGIVGFGNRNGELVGYNGRPARIRVDQGNITWEPEEDPEISVYEQILGKVVEIANKTNAMQEEVSKKIDKNQGTENAGRAMVVDEDGVVRPGEYDSGGIKKESDPTVPAWAKRPTKPKYTPQEIGAQPAGDYALKSEIPYVPVQSVNGKAGTVKLSASDVGALPDSTKIPAKNSDLQNDSGYITVSVATLLNYYLKSETYAKGETYSQTEVDELISGLDKRLNAITDSDDETMDQLSEIVEYIKANKDLIDSITTSKVSVADIVDNLTTDVSNKPLSAAQGVALKKLIDGLSTGKLDANKLPEAINTALAQAKASGEFEGEDGTSVTVSSVKESTEDGGNNVVTFSDGTALTVKNGKTGAAGDPGKSAFAYAQDGGYTGTEEEFAQKLASESGGVDFTTDETLTLQNGVLSVNTADAVEEDNTLPITSAAVFQTVGNIEILLKTI